MTARSDLLLAVADELLQHHPRGRVAVAIDGIDARRTTRFADELAIVIASSGRPVVRASHEGFHRPPAERYARGEDSAIGYYRESFDEERLRAELVEPFRRGDVFVTSIGTAPTDSIGGSAAEPAAPDTVLLVDGVFLLRPELRGLWNAAARLDVRPEVLLAESDESDAARERHAGGHAIYEREASPRRAAGIVIDDSDPLQPLRLFVDYC
ncbi:uridine kinase [Agromyces atrinae]|uniref:uridine kinase n=1 Tax=Agromyces atrinae TaxID=592376 RepID=UPI001F59BA6F|nr:uridine kinase [Agromyces atrinae]MCI2958992.1 uridine kinase [Agromyces atrinae]